MRQREGNWYGWRYNFFVDFLVNKYDKDLTFVIWAFWYKRLFFFWNVTFFQGKSTSNLKPDGGKTFNLSRPKARHLNWSKPCLLQIRTLVGWNLHWRTLKSYRQSSGSQGRTSRFGHPNRYYSPLDTLNWIKHATTSPFVGRIHIYKQQISD